MSQAFFTDDFFQFFKDLAANNNRDWFQANKQRYEQSVKIPFEGFVAEIIKRVRAENLKVEVEPKQAIFRIYRDIRFSKDKTPYKTYVSAIIAKDGRKGRHNPGMYLELNPEQIRVYGGIYMPEKDVLYAVREYIANNLKKFEEVINDKGFKKFYREILGEKNKVIPKEFKEAGEKQPIVYNKAFYYFTEIPLKDITNPKLADKVMDAYRAAKPVREFLHKVV